ncbi:manganese efflux pump [Bowmanella dokdonensis]|uniref:Manganese efflux pump n=1 Tax=Bowmanella dokdonensis TaxID=751969 RepID=A0A939DRS9_9ALTE|nr:manganese efflux pump [Bowmanella dokdonensis]MBN7826721.1 manganese efflux pump [Bowmanella dokdonensis]
MELPLLDFVLASVLMGLGIGADVALATLLRARHLNTWRAAAIWILGVSLTHTLFPMSGYLLAYLSIQWLPGITPLVGILAFVCVVWYLKVELWNAPQDEAQERQLVLSLGLILAVSWDALWSGPAKSAQVIDWPELLVWLSFVLVGMVVAGMALMSLRLGRLFRLTEHPDSAAWVPIGQWLQYSVIAYFGLLALLRYTLSLPLLWWQILILASGLMGAWQLVQAVTGRLTQSVPRF